MESMNPAMVGNAPGIPPSLVGRKISAGVPIVPEPHDEKGSKSHRRRSNKARSRLPLPPPVSINQTSNAAPPKIDPRIVTRPAFSWPEIVLTNEDDETDEIEVSADAIRWRRASLQNHAHALKVKAYQEFLIAQVAPLNPVLAAPPCPHFVFGTRLERMFETNVVTRWMSKRHGLPSVVWDVRNPPNSAFITAWPYSPDPSMNRKEQMKRAPVSASEILRFYNQAVTNPPSTVIRLHVTKEWSIHLRSFDPSRILCVRDVIEAVFSALNGRMGGEEMGGYDPKCDSRINSHNHQQHRNRYDTLGGRFLWVGLRREYSEHVQGVPVGLRKDGEIDGGTWWLVLRKP